MYIIEVYIENNMLIIIPNALHFMYFNINLLSIVKFVFHKKVFDVCWSWYSHCYLKLQINAYRSK